MDQKGDVEPSAQFLLIQFHAFMCIAPPYLGSSIFIYVILRVANDYFVWVLVHSIDSMNY